MLNAHQMNSPVNESSRALRIPWRSALALAGCVFVLWLVHPPLLSWGLRLALVRAASEAGLQLEIGRSGPISARPILLEGLRFRATNAGESQTAADIGRIEVSLNWPWHAFFATGDFFARWSPKMFAVWSISVLTRFRDPSRVADLSEMAQRGRSRWMLRWMPEYFEVRHGNLEFLAPGQSYYFEGISAEFSEERIGEFRASGAELWAGSFNESLGSLEAITAWKDGTAYLASLDLREGVRVESFVAQLARPGGVALGLEASFFGGSLRADVSFGSEKGLVAVDSAVSGSQVDVAPLAALFGFRGKAEGVIREARFTFRGIPGRALDGQASLRLAADGFRMEQARLAIARGRGKHDPPAIGGERFRAQAKGKRAYGQRRTFA